MDGDELFLTDLYLARQWEGNAVVSFSMADLDEARGDLRLTTRRQNLAQAIINRLMTRRGELSSLGHPDYGSRLYLIPGEHDVVQTRLRAELYIRECLADEARVDHIVSIHFPPPRHGFEHGLLEILLIVQPISDDAPLTLNLSVRLR